MRVDAPNVLWCADFKGEFMLADRRYCYPLTVTDHASRFLLLCEALDSTREDLAKLEPAFPKIADVPLDEAGTTFRKLEPPQKENLDSEKAIRLMVAQPSCIRRPVIDHPGGLLVGFDESEWNAALG